VFSLAFTDCVMRGWWPGADPGVTGAAGAAAGSAAAADERPLSKKRTRIVCRGGHQHRSHSMHGAGDSKSTRGWQEAARNPTACVPMVWRRSSTAIGPATATPMCFLMVPGCCTMLCKSAVFGDITWG
jgi:hypothetical protein